MTGTVVRKACLLSVKTTEPGFACTVIPPLEGK